jgi:hypothetical protein
MYTCETNNTTTTSTGSFPRVREFVHAVGLLDASEDEVANFKGSFFENCDHGNDVAVGRDELVS